MNLLTMLAQNEPNLEAAGAAIAGIVIVVVLVVLVIWAAIYVTVCLITTKALKAIPEQYQQLSPGLVWLWAIPIIDLVGYFFIGLKVPASFKAYFDSQGRNDLGDCGKGIGMGLAICSVCRIVPIVNSIAGLAMLVLIIIYLIKINGLKNQILVSGAAPTPVPMAGSPDQGPPTG